MESNWKKKAIAAAQKLNFVGNAEKDKILLALADAVTVNKNIILSENQKDLEEMDRLNPMYDRLMLTEKTDRRYRCRHSQCGWIAFTIRTVVVPNSKA